MQAEGFDKRGFANARYAGDADTKAVSSVRQDFLEQLLSSGSIAFTRAFDQGDRPGQRAAIASDQIRAGDRDHGRAASGGRVDRTQHLARSLGNAGAGTKDAFHAGQRQEPVILSRYHATGDHDDIAGILALQRIE
jgi:hypothetical protein